MLSSGDDGCGVHVLISGGDKPRSICYFLFCTNNFFIFIYKKMVLMNNSVFN